MKKISVLFSVSSSIVATVLLMLGFGAVAAKIDPITSKAKSISTSDVGHIASLPCIGGGGGGGADDGDPVDRSSPSRELA